MREAQLTQKVVLNGRETQLPVVLLFWGAFVSVGWGAFVSVGCLCDHPATTQMHIFAPPPASLEYSLTQVSSSLARLILLKLL